MGTKRTFSDALARLTGERVASPAPSDPTFQALCLNLSHILQQPATSPRVHQAATVSWRNHDRQCSQLPSAVWPAAAVQDLQEAGGLIVLPPVGCNLCPACIADSITGYLLSPDPTAPMREFCGSPAHIWLAPIAEAHAENRPIWFGWLAAPPSGRNGQLVEIFSRRSPHPLDDVIADILHRSEEVLRALPGQCLADKPFWRHPYQLAEGAPSR